MGGDARHLVNVFRVYGFFKEIRIVGLKNARQANGAGRTKLTMSTKTDLKLVAHCASNRFKNPAKCLVTDLKCWSW